MRLADIHTTAKTAIHCGTDSTTPNGTFYATTRIMASTITYLLAGEVGDPAAPIIGKIVDGDFYLGNRIHGGGWFMPASTADGFNQMLAWAMGSLIVHNPTEAFAGNGRTVCLGSGKYALAPVAPDVSGLVYFITNSGRMWSIPTTDPNISVIV